MKLDEKVLEEEIEMLEKNHDLYILTTVNFDDGKGTTVVRDNFHLVEERPGILHVLGQTIKLIADTNQMNPFDLLAEVGTCMVQDFGDEETLIKAQKEAHKEMTKLYGKKHSKWKNGKVRRKVNGKKNY